MTAPAGPRTLWADLDAESRKPGPTMTITKAQYAALAEATALDCPCGHDESDHVHYCSADMEQGSCDCAEEYVRLAATYQQEG